MLFPSLRARRYEAQGVRGDVVIYDESRAHELYREGPYDEISAPRSLKRVAAEIEREGLDHFLRRRQTERTRPRTLVGSVLRRGR